MLKISSLLIYVCVPPPDRKVTATPRLRPFRNANARRQRLNGPKRDVGTQALLFADVHVGTNKQTRPPPARRNDSASLFTSFITDRYERLIDLSIATLIWTDNALLLNIGYWLFVQFPPRHFYVKHYGIQSMVGLRLGPIYTQHQHPSSLSGYIF